MPRLLFLTCVFNILFAGITFSQRPTPTSTGEDVVKISTNLIQMDVTVTDKNGKSVRNLRPEDFDIYENGKKQSISSFSFVSDVRGNDRPKTQTNDLSVTQLPPTAPPRRPERIGRTIALVIDDGVYTFAPDGSGFARLAHGTDFCFLAPQC